ncbi:unnamed protein product [Arctia plantaginis]|uniref:Uncharacterized protein n=1 Tax=Arctia plantaginis TaxID=874455 RepID=A0A8S0ZEC3_ARCPL|nr:unnamed protein product [Arctia plantaginis]
MHSWYLLLLIVCFTKYVIGRPQEAEYANDSDVEETDEEEDSAADAYSADEEDSRPNDQEPAVQEDEVPRSRHLLDLTESRYLQSNLPGDRIARVKATDTVLDNRGERNRELHEEANFDEQRKSYPKRRQLNRYNDASDEQQEIQQHLTNHDVSKSSHMQPEDEIQANKRTIEFEPTANEEEGDMIFARNRDQVSYINKNENTGNDAPDSEQPRYIKQYYNTMQAENKDMIADKAQDGAHFKLRDRREIKEANQSDNSNLPSTENKESNDKQDSEDEESAIKRHIRKLSKTELDQLLSSLTEEKRELLKKIIDETDSGDNGYINKREITKKAGAVEENNYIENCQSDLSKVQGGSPSLETKTEISLSQTTETESSKPESGSDSSETTQKIADLNLAPNQNDDGVQKTPDGSLNTFSLNIDSKDSADILSNVQVTSKTENKRETNLEDLEEGDDSAENNNISGQDYSNNQGYFCSQDESNVDDDQPHLDKHYKRETYYDKQSDFSESMKSLEESFPNSNAYEQDSGSYSGPLVRVKRKNYDQIVKKRAARLLPDAKVAYFPYKAENEDEDNEEGNEFDDEGFYDRTSNFVNSNKAVEEETADKVENSIQPKSGSADNSKSSNENIESDTRSLGSDTDSVLSGVEGVDDNLMYNSGTRNKRTADENSSDATQTEAESSTSVMQDEVKSPSENFINVPHYQENDAFGPLPRSYDGDFTRYKRIRRVKQLHNAQDINSNI